MAGKVAHVKMEVAEGTDINSVFTTVAEQVRGRKNIQGFKHASIDKNMLLLKAEIISYIIIEHFKQFGSKRGCMLRSFEVKELPKPEAGESKKDQESGPQPKEILLQVEERWMKKSIMKIANIKGIEEIFIDTEKKQLKLTGKIDVAKMGLELRKYNKKDDVVQTVSRKGTQEKKAGTEANAKDDQEDARSLSPKLKEVVLQFEDNISYDAIGKAMEVKGLNAISVEPNRKLKVVGHISVAELATKLGMSTDGVYEVSSVIVKKGLKKSNFPLSTESKHFQWMLKPKKWGEEVDWQKVMKNLATYDNVERVSIKRQENLASVTAKNDALSICEILKPWSPKIVKVEPANKGKNKEEKEEGDKTNDGSPFYYKPHHLICHFYSHPDPEVEHDMSCHIM